MIRLPKKSFEKLSEEKKSTIINAALAEFGSHSYHDSSLNNIVKITKIPKGSIYQYFEDKLDLYKYILMLATNEKICFFTKEAEISKELSIFELVKMLFRKGIQFASMHPQFAAVGNQFAKETNEKLKKEILQGANESGESFFTGLVEAAKLKGDIDNKLNTKACVQMFMTLNQAVLDEMLKNFEIETIGLHEEEMYEWVDQLLDILINGMKSN
ncbi:MAG: TetR/AcrR family transcriptional regulator [Firmicutes bacterium HGW-Firmicutes-1]|jgi:AcrR family transcriptional regulator|nr:MAG: TetR/AcrR family transcriptional regulator [Firmicutes bacterium HGW-Firmicutes-1]